MPTFDIAKTAEGIEVDENINSRNIQKDLLLEGELNFIGLADVFQILGGNSSTGVLQLTSPYNEIPAEVYFKNGNPVNATYGSLDGLEAIYPLFGWTEGNFEFRHEERKPAHIVNHSRMQIVLDALRMLDDGLIKTVGPPRFIDPSPPSPQIPDIAAYRSLQEIKGPLVDYMYVVQEEYLSDGDRIVTEGAYGNWVWVILEGRVRITRETLRGPRALAQLGDGCFIGTFTSFLFSDYVRTATATAMGDVHLGLLDTQRLAGEFASLSNNFRNFLLALSAKLKTISNRVIYLTGECPRDRTIEGGGNLVQEGLLPSDKFMHEDKAVQLSNRIDIKDGLLPMVPLQKEDILEIFLFNSPLHNRRAGEGDHSHGEPHYDSMDREKMRKEYEGLSRTFKNMMDYLAACIATTTTLACQVEKNKKGLEQSCLSP